MTLAQYRKKRDFSVTTEPKGRKATNLGASFVVQKHDARRLHYDFRLEIDGALKSWAVTKGPSLVPGEKRLAVHVEDHPIAYGDFEGTIPKGEYGGGTVIVWDRGRWTPIGDARRGYAKGHLEFELEGEKLRGRWRLVRMHGKPDEKHENWLLIKGEDEYACDKDAPDVLDELPNSAKTGRDLIEVAGDKAAPEPKSRPRAKAPKAADNAAIQGARRTPLPAFVGPALATLVSQPPSGDNWLHEIKFDGYRVLARVEDKQVALMTRSGHDWTRKFGKAIPAELLRLPVTTALLDGELVVENGSGALDFSLLQRDLSEGRDDRFVYYAFDLLHLDGQDLRGAPLSARKQRLERIIGAEPSVVRFSGDFAEAGDLVLRHACRLGLEGVVSKMRDAPYRSGRGKTWVKSKCSARQEFVIGGYVPSTSMPDAVGSLVLGVHEGKALHGVGRVGAGFTVAVAEDLFKQLSHRETKSSPFTPPLSAEAAREVRYVKPDLVAEVEFRAWTADGILRHASFRGLREDKPAAEIARETPTSTKMTKPSTRTIKLTHPDRLLWPDQGVTKEGLADYYTEVWPYIAPFVIGRPLALVRCPDGVGGPTFFQKHAWQGLSAAITEVHDPQHKDEKPLITINDLDGLMSLVQAAVLEIHPWGSTVADWERPDTITMDLDPGEGVPWEAVMSAAREVKARLEQAGLAAFVKTSGGKGLHIVAPLKPSADWAWVKAFTMKFAQSMASDSPDAFVATIAKVKRRGKILVDYLRNQRGATAVAAYSTRARPGATVSMPLAWSELIPGLEAKHFTIENALKRLGSMRSDPWADFRSAAVPMEAVGPRGKRKR